MGAVIRRWQEVKPLQWRKITVLLRRHFLYACNSSWAGSEYTNKASRVAPWESVLVYVRPWVLSPALNESHNQADKGVFVSLAGSAPRHRLLPEPYSQIPCERTLGPAGSRFKSPSVMAVKCVYTTENLTSTRPQYLHNLSPTNHCQI